jgi:hypothetical protein
MIKISKNKKLFSTLFWGRFILKIFKNLVNKIKRSSKNFARRVRSDLHIEQKHFR